MMRHGHSDNTIDFYASSFSREILDTAHSARFSKERITYGNDIFTGFRGDIWPANTNDEIAKGRLKPVGMRRIPLARLADGSRPYGRLLDNMLRPFGQKGTKDHFLTTYDKPVSFTIFDFDRHPPKGPSGAPSTEDDEWLSIDDAFWKQVSAFHEIAERLAIDVMWVQSPGRWLVDGHDMPCRMFGLYAIIRHESRKPSELRPMLAAFNERVGLDVETSWDTRNRNIRIPGQCFMDVCRVDPVRRSIAPIRDAGASGERGRNMARLVATVDGYEKLRREGGERMLRGEGAQVAWEGRLSIHRKERPPEGAGGLAASPSGNGESPAVGSSGAQQCMSPSRLGKGPVTSPSRRTATAKPGSTSARNPDTAADNTNPSQWRREPDTFRVLHESGLLRRALRKFGWEAGSAQEAAEWAAPRLRRLRPTSSATCSDDKTLTEFLGRHYRWGCETFDPAKAMDSARLRARIADQARIAPSLRLDDRALEAYLKGVGGLTEAELRSFRRFRALERRHAGRVACRTLYSAFGGQRRFMAFQARHDLLAIAQEYSQSVGRCRQWTLAPSVVRSVGMLMASPVLLFMMCGGGERVTYSNTRRHGPIQKRRTSAVSAVWEARHALDSVTVALVARGPPPEAPKTREKAGFGTNGRATGARRHDRIWPNCSKLDVGRLPFGGWPAVADIHNGHWVTGARLWLAVSGWKTRAARIHCSVRSLLVIQRRGETMSVYQHLDRNCQRIVVEHTRKAKPPCPECASAFALDGRTRTAMLAALDVEWVLLSATLREQGGGDGKGRYDLQGIL